MSEQVNIIEAFQNSDQLAAIAQAMKESQSKTPPVGSYVLRYRGMTPANYTDKTTGTPMLAVNVNFDIDQAHDDPRWTGKKVSEFCTLSNNPDKTRGRGWFLLEKLYRGLFHGKITATPEGMTEALAKLQSNEAVGSAWTASYIQNGQYVNLKINGLANE